MAALLRLLFVFLLFTFFRYVFNGLVAGLSRARQARGRARPPSQKPGVPQVKTGRMVRDPVCGTFVAQELSLTARTDNETFYFCSGNCRDSYLATLRQPQRSKAR